LPTALVSQAVCASAEVAKKIESGVAVVIRIMANLLLDKVS
jgi:hypothetical protein